MAPQLVYYGDDFSGSADVMEVLQWSGRRTVLFLDPPAPATLAQFQGLFAYGIAGTSRTMSPAEMEASLPSLFAHLRSSGARFVHYKICSTFDSSPHIGSIGKAIEIGRHVFATSLVPVLAAAPQLGRYQIFGNLFARSGLDSEPYRLDRHPTMRTHPITPMDEADLRLHLTRQTALSVRLLDALRLESSGLEQFVHQASQDDCAILLCDSWSVDHLRKLGSIFELLAGESGPLFVVGSSGVEYALTAMWTSSSVANEADKANRDIRFGPTNQLLVITGSCSPVTERQLMYAESRGLSTISIDTPSLVDAETRNTAIRMVVQEACSRLAARKSVILHTSRGPEDLRILKTNRLLQHKAATDQNAGDRGGNVIGRSLGEIAAAILQRHPLQRIGIAGGDTSGHVARAMGIEALEAVAPVAPGSPLCRVHARNQLDGLEIIFKGGQVGRDNIWETLLHGTT